MSRFKKEKIHGMTVIRNKFFPFPGYKAINLFGILFAKPNAKLDELTINHESIHSKQYREVALSLAIPVLLLSFSVSWWFILLVPFTFYLWYVVEWLIRVIIGQKDAYKNISLEKDAYIWQGIPEERKRYSFFKYIK